MKRTFFLIFAFFAASTSFAEFNYHGGLETKDEESKLGQAINPMRAQGTTVPISFSGNGLQDNGTIDLRLGIASTNTSYSIECLADQGRRVYSPLYGNIFVMTLSGLEVQDDKQALLSYSFGKLGATFNFMLDSSEGLDKVSLIMQFNTSVKANNKLLSACLLIENLDLSAEKNTIALGYQRGETNTEAKIFCQTYNGEEISALKFSEQTMDNWGFDIKNIQFGKNASHCELQGSRANVLIENAYFYTIDATIDLKSKYSQEQLQAVLKEAARRASATLPTPASHGLNEAPAAQKTKKTVKKPKKIDDRRFKKAPQDSNGLNIGLTSGFIILGGGVLGFLAYKRKKKKSSQKYNYFNDEL